MPFSSPPILVGVLPLGRPRLADGYALLAAVAILEFAEHIKERPIAGWGLDAARRLPGGSAQ
jgi:hypothetical protein